MYGGHGSGGVWRSRWWWCVEVTLVVYVSDNGGLCRSRWWCVGRCGGDVGHGDGVSGQGRDVV